MTINCDAYDEMWQNATHTYSHHNGRASTNGELDGCRTHTTRSGMNQDNVIRTDPPDLEVTMTFIFEKEKKSLEWECTSWRSWKAVDHTSGTAAA